MTDGEHTCEEEFLSLVSTTWFYDKKSVNVMSMELEDNFELDSGTIGKFWGIRVVRRTSVAKVHFGWNIGVTWNNITSEGRHWELKFIK